MRSRWRAWLVPAMACAVGACSSPGLSSTGSSGGAGGGGAAGGDSSSGAGGGATGGGDGGRTVDLVTFAFTGHITALVSPDDDSLLPNPQAGDPFTGSYTFNANQIPFTNTGQFPEAGLGIAADLELDSWTCAFPSASAPDGLQPIFVLMAYPTAYSVSIHPFGVTPFTHGAGMNFSWSLSGPSGAGPLATRLSTVPPDLSVWMQGPAAVSIQLADTSNVGWTASGVIDTIEVR